MTELFLKHCSACEGKTQTLDFPQIKKLLLESKGWDADVDHTHIFKRFSFKDFYQTMSFVNAIAWIANQENHHPHLEVGYNYCLIKYSTHAVKGLTENDFICAAKIDQLTM